MEHDAVQELAINMCCDLDRRLVTVTGEAGTGKTTLIKRLCEKLEADGVTFALAAPTGKAARRIREATGVNAVTIHKLLGFNRPEFDPETGDAMSSTRPTHTRNNPLPYSVVICDEYAMVSTGLHRDLVEAVGRGALRLFGDIRQLPPIENEKLADSTAPFYRCLKMPHSVTLDKVYRQEGGNGILEAARAINRGSMFGQNDDLKLIISDSMVARLYDDVRSGSVDWTSLTAQIISPVRKSDVGTVRLNAVLQSILNAPMVDAITLPRHKWEVKNNVTVAVGDKIVCNTNTYDLRDYSERYSEWESDTIPVQETFIPCPDTKQILNGEVGIVQTISPDGNIEIDLGDRVVEIPPAVEEYSRRHRVLFLADHRKSLDLAYALTTHKCQGSEYDVVAYVMANAGFYNLSRQNFYTAITRARNKVFVYTDQRALGVSLRNVAVSKRK